MLHKQECIRSKGRHPFRDKNPNTYNLFWNDLDTKMTFDFEMTLTHRHYENITFPHKRAVKMFNMQHKALFCLFHGTRIGPYLQARLYRKSTDIVFFQKIVNCSTCRTLFNSNRTLLCISFTSFRRPF